MSDLTDEQWKQVFREMVDAEQRSWKQRTEQQLAYLDYHLRQASQIHARIIEAPPAPAPEPWLRRALRWLSGE